VGMVQYAKWEPKNPADWKDSQLLSQPLALLGQSPSKYNIEEWTP